jgi:hypothetical protein
LPQLKKVTRFFAVAALSLLIVALGFMAKHGQFESPAQHGHFLSQAVKMENPSHGLDVVFIAGSTPPPVYLCIALTIQPARRSPAPPLPPSGFSVPLLV